MDTPKYTLKLGAYCVKTAGERATAAADAGDRDAWRAEMFNALASITCALRQDAIGCELGETEQ